MSQRKKLSDTQRSNILIANRHSCCVCAGQGVQIHHINGDNSDNRSENLAVLCLQHHDKATSPPGLSASLKAKHIIEYKQTWEENCRTRAEKIANGRTSFFMVDYKNAERIRQLYAQLSTFERNGAYAILSERFRQESNLRKEQGFDVSLEPNTNWSPTVENLLEELKTGKVHPDIFEKCEGHASDPLLPLGPAFATLKPIYDIWCQIMVRAIITARRVYDLDDLMLLQRPESAGLEGTLVSFKAKVVGEVAMPEDNPKDPVTETSLIAKNETSTWESVLRLKKHYIYSQTAAFSLSDGTPNGILILRHIRNVNYDNGIKVNFDSIPLIIGSGALEIP